jgi:hypothetical protein
MNTEFKVTVCSHPDYEELIAEIDLAGEFFGLLSQEGGEDVTMFEVAPSRTPFKVRLSTFEEALAYAKRRLAELRKDQ